MNNCDECEKPTKNLKFCSRSCAAKFNNKNSPKRKKTRICALKECNDYTKRSDGKFCQEHTIHPLESSHEHMTLKVAKKYFQKNKKDPSFFRTKITEAVRHKHKHLKLLPCKYCNYSKHVELCHIKPVNSFPEDALLSEINHEDNIVQLCPNHHWELDNGILKIEDIL